MARVSDLHGERVRTIKTVLFFIVSVHVYAPRSREKSKVTDLKR